MVVVRQTNIVGLSSELAHAIHNPATVDLDPTAFAGYLDARYGESSDPEQRLGALVGGYIDAGFSPDRLAQRAEDAGCSALVEEQTNAALSRAEDDAARLRRDIAGHLPRQQQLLVVSEHLGRTGHGDDPRRSGKMFWSHPWQSAAIGYAALELSQPSPDDPAAEDEQALTEAILAVLFQHDLDETYDERRTRGETLPKILARPALLRSIARQTGNPRGQEMADALRLMVPYPELSGAPDYRAQDLISVNVPLKRMAKLPDRLQNRRVDPKPRTPDNYRRVAQRDGDYDFCIKRSMQLVLALAGCERPMDWRYAPNPAMRRELGFMATAIGFDLQRNDPRLTEWEAALRLRIGNHANRHDSAPRQRDGDRLRTVA